MLMSDAPVARGEGRSTMLALGGRRIGGPLKRAIPARIEAMDRVGGVEPDLIPTPRAAAFDRFREGA